MVVRLFALWLLTGCQIALNVKPVATEGCDEHPPPIGYVQASDGNPLATRVVDVALPQPEMECDFLAVHIAAGRTTPGIASVTDDVGNTYALATKDTYEALYYASAISGGTNTIHVTFSAVAPSPDVRVVEYQGVAAASPLEVAVSATGMGTDLVAGPLTTKYGYELLVGGDSVAGQTGTVDQPYTQRLRSTPNGNVAVDSTVTASGSYMLSLTQSASAENWWTVNLAAFRGALSSPP